MTEKAGNPSLHRQAIQALTSGNMETGISLLKQALVIEPQSANLHNDIAAAYMQARQPRNALLHLAQAVSLSPGNITALGNYVILLKKLGLAEKAEEALVVAANNNPENASVFCELGAHYATQHKRDEAVTALKKSLALDRSAEKTWIRLLSCLEAENMHEEAAELLPEALELFPDSADIALQAAKILRRQKRADEALAMLEKFAPNDNPAQRGAFFYFELGQLYDLADNTPKAFAAYTQGNAIKARRAGTGIVQQGRAITASIARIRKEAQAIHAPITPLPQGMTAPAFIVGFPRSGTTLLEQAIASHPEASVAGERPGVDAMFARLEAIHDKNKSARPPRIPFWQRPEYPTCLETLEDKTITALRKAYFEEHAKHTDIKGRVFVDKSPLNMMHAPLIRRVFPDAKFILALRHPCDAVLSCFMQNFRPNAFMSRFMSIEDAARFYEEIFGLWDSFTKSVVQDAYETRYEDTVSDFRTSVAGVLDHLGLEWDDAVLDYDRTAKEQDSIRTASYHQVTEKIYTRASGRWLKYREQLVFALPLLAPYIERYGYAAE